LSERRGESVALSLRQRCDPLGEIVEHPKASWRQLAFPLHLSLGFQRAGQKASRRGPIDPGQFDIRNNKVALPFGVAGVGFPQTVS